MSKIICDVCGTRYPESAEACPICGCARASGGKTVADDIIMDEAQPAASSSYVKGGRFSKSNVRKRNQDTVYYEEEPEIPHVKAAPVSREPKDEEYGVPEIAQKRKSNVVLNVLLVIVIIALLCVSAYIFVEYFMPGIMEQAMPTAEPTYVEQTELPTEPEITEAPTIPCTDIIWVDEDSSSVILEAEGNNWLLNYVIEPADTTDTVSYYSSDESVVTVNSEGCLTAVAEGQAIVTIVCGNVELECEVICSFVEETLPEETQADETEATADGEENTSETEPDAEATEAPEETTAPTAPTEPLKNVKLEVNYTDITLTGHGQQFKFKLKELDNSEAVWSCDNENVVTVDDQGVVTRVGKGTANVTVKYGDQEVVIIIRCR